MATEYKLSFTAQEIDEKLGKITDVDQTYNPTSENAQSGKAIAPVLQSKLEIWQPDTEYKVGDVVYATSIGDNGATMDVIAECIETHTSTEEETDFNTDLSKWQVKNIFANSTRTDSKNNIIHETYATKEEVGNIEDQLNNVIEITNNQFTLNSVILGVNAVGSPYSTRAITQPFKINGDITVSVKTLPSNLKYEVDGYDDENFGGRNVYSDGWITAANKVCTVSGKNYARILFGSVNDKPLTIEDFEGLEMQIEDGKNSTPYAPPVSAVDYVARNSVVDFPVKLKICSYNVGMYSYGVPTDTPPENAINNLKSFLCDNNFDIMGIQENRTNINGINVNDTVFGYVFNSQFDTINWTCLKSQYPFQSAGKGAFTAGSRTYCYAKAKIGNKDVFIMCVHLGTSWAERESNYAELLNILSKHERFIVFGDFNASNDYGTPEQAQLEYDILKNAGYKVANGGFLGLFPTHHSNAGWQDNIFVSSNIQIVNSGSLKVYNEMNSDHIPVFAEIVV